jgi:hypothetical protein
MDADVFNKLRIDGVEGEEYQYIRKNSNGIHPVKGSAITTPILSGRTDTDHAYRPRQRGPAM